MSAPLMPCTVLLVHDDPVQTRLLAATVDRLGYRTLAASRPAEALSLLRSDAGSSIDLVLVDLGSSELAEASLAERVKELCALAPVIVQAAPHALHCVGPALRAGAVDFVVRPAGAERLQVAIANALRLRALEAEIRRLNPKTEALSLKDLTTASADMVRALRRAERAAKSALPVLIEGEPGVGKAMLARAIHASSDRRAKAFVAVRCSSIAQDGAPACLFTGRGGAPSGAAERRAGKLAQAQGGTLFLDDVGALPAEAQTALLQVLQSGETKPIGAHRPMRIDVRVIAATSASLIDLVRRGRFREDLYYRLNMLPMTLPPLRARREDIAGLARALTARFAAEEGKRLRGVSAQAVAVLECYEWPGNVRQLENAVFRAVALADGPELTVHDFPQIAAQADGSDLRGPPPQGLPGPAQIREIVEVEVRDPHALNLIDETGRMRSLQDLEAEILRFALGHCRGRMSEASRRLGIGRSTLYRKLRDLGLENADADAAA